MAPEPRPAPADSPCSTSRSGARLRRNATRVGLEAVGAGVSVWAAFAVYEALRQVTEETDRARSFRTPTLYGRATLYVFDEPEHHLHPAAQREAAAFVSSIVANGGNVIVATHAPAFLNEPNPHAFLVKLSRTERTTKALPLDSGRLTAVEQNLGELGLTRADLIHLTRGVLLVEGDQDKLVVDSWFAAELADAHVRVLTLFGSHNTLALIDAGLLRSLEIRMFLMLDHTRDEYVNELKRGKLTRASTDEERRWASLAVALGSDQFASVINVSISVPDIVWTLHEDAIRKLAPKFPGWEQATADFKRHKQIKPKDLLHERYGLPKITLHTLQRLISIAQEHELAPSAELKGKIARVADMSQNASERT